MKKVYTKTGDQGTSALINGERVSKASLIFEALGTLDESNASLGLVVLAFSRVPSSPNFDKRKQVLLSLQNELFKLGAELALSPRVMLGDRFIEKLEAEIDFLQDDLGAAWHYKFVLPGGSELSAHLDLSRTICRRLERVMVALSKERTVRPQVLQFVNRISDYLFALRTWINAQLDMQEVEFDALA